MSKKFNNSRVQSNLLQQNCFVRDVTLKSDLSVPSIVSFESIDEVVTDKGVEVRKTVEPYHITPQYVSSFVDSVDYRKDPIGAIANSFKRLNLGDITDVQKVASMDVSSARALYAELQKRFAEVKSDVKKDVKTDIPGGDNNE